MYSSDVQCSLEIALWANDVQVNNEQKAGAIVTEELVGSTIGRDMSLVVEYYSIEQVLLILRMSIFRVSWVNGSDGSGWGHRGNFLWDFSTGMGIELRIFPRSKLLRTNP